QQSEKRTSRLFRRISAMGGVERHKQDILALESQINGMKVAQSAQEEAGSHQQDERESDLRDDQASAHSLSRSAEFKPASASIHTRNQVGSAGAPGRRKTEQQGRQD